MCCDLLAQSLAVYHGDCLLSTDLDAGQTDVIIERYDRPIADFRDTGNLIKDRCHVGPVFALVNVRSISPPSDMFAIR